MPNRQDPHCKRQSRHLLQGSHPHGTYSVKPSFRVERQACAEPGRSADWLDHRAHVFADLAPTGNRGRKYTCCMYKNKPEITKRI